MNNRREGQIAHEELSHALVSLGFTEELGALVAKNLGSPKAIRRMISYLYNVKPKTDELIVDEMLAIMSEISAWREKRASEEANAAYNHMLYYGLGNDAGDEEW